MELVRMWLGIFKEPSEDLVAPSTLPPDISKLRAYAAVAGILGIVLLYTYIVNRT